MWTLQRRRPPRALPMTASDHRYATPKTIQESLKGFPFAYSRAPVSRELAAEPIKETKYERTQPSPSTGHLDPGR